MEKKSLTAERYAELLECERELLELKSSGKAAERLLRSFKRVLPPRDCLECGVEYQPFATYQKFCSMKCRNRVMKRKQRARMRERLRENNVYRWNHGPIDAIVREIGAANGKAKQTERAREK